MAISKGISVQDDVLISRQIVYTETSPILALEVPAGCVITDVKLLITSAWTSGGTATLDVGDSDNDDGWIDNTDVTAATTGVWSGAITGDSAYKIRGGRYYSTANKILLTTGGTPTAGAAHVTARIIRVNDIV